MLEASGFKQLVDEATHFQGGHIDHVYCNNKPDQFQVDITLYSPFYLDKDHDALLITVTKTPTPTRPGMGKYEATHQRRSISIVYDYLRYEI